MRPFGFVLLAACGAQSTGESLTFDPCASTVVSAPHATTEQLASIDDALAMWRADGVTGLTRGDTAEITVEFRDAAASIYGFYDTTTATLYVNTRLADPGQRAITIAHELGHALGLVHVSAATRISVMNPGNLITEPTASDSLALESLWGACQF
ncbi:MAG TPA: ImmA/IrrE family metallo-endopeptidase [Kofleriaceae bacterium]|nr:ImmA/IrrE family metallo-endopeptidase [Kofleriaceae bacterium]